MSKKKEENKNLLCRVDFIYEDGEMKVAMGVNEEFRTAFKNLFGKGLEKQLDKMNKENVNNAVQLGRLISKVRALRAEKEK